MSDITTRLAGPKETWNRTSKPIIQDETVYWYRNGDVIALQNYRGETVSMPVWAFLAIAEHIER